MRPDVVVVVAPDGQFAAGINQGVKDLLVEAFVAQTDVERPYVAVLLRFTWIDLVPFDAVLVCPFQDGGAGKSGSAIGDDAGRLARNPNQGIKFPRHPSHRDRGNLKHDRPPMWILADPPWHINVVKERSHHPRPKNYQILQRKETQNSTS